VDATAPLHLTSEDAGDVINYDVAGGPGVPVFDDSDPDAYWDDLWGISAGSPPRWQASAR
jgi:hypothetical protein